MKSYTDKFKMNSQHVKKIEKCESLDEGTFAFLNWMNCKSFIEEDFEKNPPLLLKNINLPNPDLVKLCDRYLGNDVIVDMIDSILQCKKCRSDDCSHVGFAICLFQLIEREGLSSMDEITKLLNQ
jgi:hypothetical protein